MPEKQTVKREIPAIQDQRFDLLDVQLVIAKELRQSGVLGSVENATNVDLKENPQVRPVIARRYIRPEETEDGHGREELLVNIVDVELGADGLVQVFKSVPVVRYKLGDAPGQNPEISDGFDSVQASQLEKLAAQLLDHKIGNREPWLPNLDPVSLSTINDPGTRMMVLPGVKTA